MVSFNTKGSNAEITSCSESRGTAFLAEGHYRTPQTSLWCLQTQLGISLTAAKRSLVKQTRREENLPLGIKQRGIFAPLRWPSHLPQTTLHHLGQRQSGCICPSPCNLSHTHTNHPNPLPCCLFFPQVPQAPLYRIQNPKIQILNSVPSLLSLTLASSKVGLPHFVLMHHLSLVLMKPRAQHLQIQQNQESALQLLWLLCPIRVAMGTWQGNCRNPQVHPHPPSPACVAPPSCCPSSPL